MDINEEHCEPDNDSSNNISFLLELKNHLKNERLYLEYLHESYDNLSILHFLLLKTLNYQTVAISDFVTEIRIMLIFMVSVIKTFAIFFNTRFFQSCIF